MPENPPRKEELKEKSEKLCEETEESSWEQDQKRRGYYYDDAHGYEVYDPDEDKETDEDSPFCEKD